MTKAKKSANKEVRVNSFAVARKLSRQQSMQIAMNDAVETVSSSVGNSIRSLASMPSSNPLHADERIAQITEYAEEFLHEHEFTVQELEMLLLRPRMLEDEGTMKICMLMLTQLDKMIKQAGVDCFEWVEFTASTYNPDELKRNLSSSQFKAAVTRLCTDLRQPCYEDRDLLRLFRFIAGERDDAIVDHCNLDIALKSSRKNSAKLHKFKTFFTLVRDLGIFMKRTGYHLGGKEGMVDKQVHHRELEKMIYTLLTKFDTYVTEGGSLEPVEDDNNAEVAIETTSAKSFAQQVTLRSRVSNVLNRWTKKLTISTGSKKENSYSAGKNRSIDSIEEENSISSRSGKRRIKPSNNFDASTGSNKTSAKITNLFALTQRLTGWKTAPIRRSFVFPSLSSSSKGSNDVNEEKLPGIDLDNLTEEEQQNMTESMKVSATVTKVNVRRKRGGGVSESIFSVLKNRANRVRETLANRNTTSS